jgi:DNA-binding winged helix-turn-helix (wHTH) protein
MIYVFDEFQVDDQLFELRRLGTRVAIQRLTLDLLVYLLRHRDRVVLRAELVEHVWGGVAITDNAIAQAVTTVRRVVEPRAGARAIDTVRGRGYRFMRRVVEHPNAGDVEQPPPEHTPPAIEPRVVMLNEVCDAAEIDGLVTTIRRELALGAGVVVVATNGVATGDAVGLLLRALKPDTPNARDVVEAEDHRPSGIPWPDKGGSAAG